MLSAAILFGALRDRVELLEPLPSGFYVLANVMTLHQVCTGHTKDFRGFKTAADIIVHRLQTHNKNSSNFLV